MRLIDVSDWRIGNATWRKRRWFDESQIGKLSDSTDLWLWRNSNTSLIGATIDSFRFQIGFNEIKCNRGEFYLEEVLWWSTLSDDWPTATLSHRYARDQYHVIHNTQQHSTLNLWPRVSKRKGSLTLQALGHSLREPQLHEICTNQN